MTPEEITALRERIKLLEEDAETYAYKDQANFDLRSRIVTLESDNAALTKELVAVFNEGLQSIRQLAAAQATNERLLEALQKGHRQLIYKLGGTYKDGYGGSDRDAEAAVLMYEALALPNDTTALDARLRAAKVDAERYRWLRNTGQQGWDGHIPQRGITIANGDKVKLHFIFWMSKEELDAAIDAARGVK